MTRGVAFAGGRFARVWNDPPARKELVEAIGRDLRVRIELVDAAGRPLETAGPACSSRAFTVPVEDANGSRLGDARACIPYRSHPPTFLLAPNTVNTNVRWKSTVSTSLKNGSNSRTAPRNFASARPS